MCARPSFYPISTILRLHRFVCVNKRSAGRRVLSAPPPPRICQVPGVWMPAALIQPQPKQEEKREKNPALAAATVFHLGPPAICFVFPSGSVLILQGAFFKLISADLFPHCRLRTRRPDPELRIALAGRPAYGLHSLRQQKSQGTFPVIPANGQKQIN